MRVELAQDIQESLKQHDEWLELLRQELEEIPVTGGAHKRRDSERGSEKARLEAQVARLGDELRQYGLLHYTVLWFCVLTTIQRP